ncbi:AMP-binding protein [Denitratisoma oestradiolicum]|uniref:Long-chain-fatty-acid--CoA ligase n=1 Tax=Denitratisoma oestradiolicum TaxID=311182 RepID=A0A6S6Y5S1_9PROT|nr:AMP-binding protein [Denitratisoma oestradiolicum]TWO81199.1 long-chain-fatty-acid--CoA ligase [Denitratisoma oestradiolicum]CAB1367898.1 acyl-CoA synthetase (long-chain-fatty-acid--CoA ligase) [Denitratisoma oestradiolicum]
MEKIWLQSYPSGISAEVDVSTYTSLADLFSASVSRFSARTAFISMGRSMSYGELDRRSADFAAWLKNVAKVGKGARVALMMPNLLQYPVCLFGALRAGCVVVNCNPLYTAPELEHQLADSGAEVIVVLENFAHVVQRVLPRTQVRHVVVTRMGDFLGTLKGGLVNFVVCHVKKMVPAWSLPHVPLTQALEQGAAAGFSPVQLEADDLAFLQYTGGTTGVSKGAMLSHGNMVANLQQAHAWIGPFLREGGELVVTALPLYHVFALTANCLTFFKIGAANLLIVNPRDIPGFVKELGRYRFTAITGVNTLFNALLAAPGFDRIDFSALTISLGGGMAVQKPVAERWKAVTGRPLIEAYGLTEASPAVTINPLDLEAFNGAIGLPLPSTEISVRDGNGVELPIGEPGELCVRGPQVMKGYWNRPDETVAVMTSDGFLRTGDMVVMDEKGFVRLVDRMKDVILVSGFKVFPNEVEAVVSSHPGVLEVAAVGVPDEHSGEAVKIFVVRRSPDLTAEALIAHCRESLTGYKVPRLVEFRNDLPKTNVGKILRRALKTTV